jgi:hypothetical protein
MVATRCGDHRSGVTGEDSVGTTRRLLERRLGPKATKGSVKQDGVAQ